VPGAGNPQAFNRYSYVLNRPTVSADPSGHMTCNVMVSGSAPVDEEACLGAQNNPNIDYVGPLDYQKPGLPVHVHRTVTEDVIKYNSDTPPVSLGTWKGWRNGSGFEHREDEIDAFGIRIEGTGGVIIAQDFNIDLLYFRRSKQVGLFLSPGFQEGVSGGSSFSGGLLISTNMPDRSTYAGLSWVLGGGDIPIPPLGVIVEGDISVNVPNAENTIPTTFYLGAGPLQPEAGGYRGGSYAIDIIDLIEQFLPK
jgi:hypothetical protein